MNNIKKITRLIGGLKDQLSACTRCGMCQAVCPIFTETGREADVARGKLALLDNLTNAMFKDPEGVLQRLNRCLLCGSCESVCPREINIVEIFIKARAILSGYKDLSFFNKVILRGILANPEFFDHLTEWGIKFQKLFIKPSDELLGTSCLRFVSPLFNNRHFKSLAPVPFHRKVPFLNSPAGSSGIKVAFFIGCIIDKVFPNVAQASLYVMNHLGVGVFIPEGLGCCGIPAISSGDATAFDRLIYHNIERLNLEDFDYLVTACATCTFTIKKIWPAMIHSDSLDVKTRVKKIAKKTMDINHFLVSKVGLQRESLNFDDHTFIITYHDPCHLKKSLGVSVEPRAVIKANKHCKLIEMDEADWCCGSGGSFNLKHYNISTHIAKRKRDNIIASGCSVVATGCPACMLQISDILSKSNDLIAVKHPIEIYAESIISH